MNTHTSTVPRLEPAGTTVAAARMAATTLAGAVVGAVVADATGVFSAIPVLVGMTIGVLASAPWPARGIDGLLGRGILVVGAATLAGALFGDGLTLAAWGLALMGLGIAAGSRDDGPVGRRVLAVACSALGAGAGFLGFFLVGEVAALSLNMEDVWLAGAAGAAVGLGAFAGTRAPSFAERARRRPRLGSRPSEATSDPGESTMAHATRSLEEAGASVLALLDRLADERPDDLLLVDEIRRGVGETLSSARRGIERWGVVQRAADVARIERLETRIATNEGERELEGDERVRRAIEATLDRQRRALEQLQSVEAMRRTFAFRLQQAEAGLEVLQLTIERAVTAGDELDHAEIDDLVDTLNEAHAFFAAESEPRATPVIAAPAAGAGAEPESA